MKHIEIPKVPALNLEKAIKATDDYLKELEQMKDEGLTDKQATALVKLTEELIPPTETDRAIVPRPVYSLLPKNPFY
jgi:hypothetical protein